jgi:hypothetical protein
MPSLQANQAGGVTVGPQDILRPLSCVDGDLLDIIRNNLFASRSQSLFAMLNSKVVQATRNCHDQI